MDKGSSTTPAALESGTDMVAAPLDAFGKGPQSHLACSNSSTAEFNYVDFDGPDDPEHPHNWSLGNKISLTAIACAQIFAVSFASSIFGPAAHLVAEQYHTSDMVMHLGVSLFVAGFAIGPLFFAPISEVIGHKSPVLVGVAVSGLLQIPLGLAGNVAAILVSRFLSGALGSAVLAVGTGMVAAPYSPVGRATAFALSATMINIGSAVAPIVGSYVAARCSWRWIAWITLIFFGGLTLAGAVFQQESSLRKILENKAKRLRRVHGAGAENIRSKSEEEPVNIHMLASKYLGKPAEIFFKEPILIILTVHLTFVYGTLYLSYQLFPLAYEKRGWPATTGSLPFLAVALGLLVAAGITTVFTLTWYKRRWLERGGRKSPPEHRLPPMIVGATLLPPALLWFGWCMERHWAAQVLASFFIGLALQLIFISGIVYLVDVYVACANSAVSAHVAVRSVVAATFPLWTGPMYDALDVEWMATALAGFSALLMPFPVLFYVFGARIRSWSKFST